MMTQEVERSYDQTFEKYRPKDGNWWDAAHCFVGLIEGILDRGDLDSREQVARVKYVLARFRELREEEARKWRL